MSRTPIGVELNMSGFFSSTPSELEEIPLYQSPNCKFGAIYVETFQVFKDKILSEKGV